MLTILARRQAGQKWCTRLLLAPARTQGRSTEARSAVSQPRPDLIPAMPRTRGTRGLQRACHGTEGADAWLEHEAANVEERLRRGHQGRVPLIDEGRAHLRTDTRLTQLTRGPPSRPRAGPGRILLRLARYPPRASVSRYVICSHACTRAAEAHHSLLHVIEQQRVLHWIADSGLYGTQLLAREGAPRASVLGVAARNQNRFWGHSRI